MDRSRPPSPSTLDWTRRVELVGQGLLLVGTVPLLVTAAMVLASQGETGIPEVPLRVAFACFSLGTALTGLSWLPRRAHPGSIRPDILVNLRRDAVTPRQHVGTVAFATFWLSGFWAVCALSSLLFTATDLLLWAICMLVAVIAVTPFFAVRLRSRRRRPRW